MLMATVAALHAHETVLEPPAAQVALELRVHERRERGPLLTQHTAPAGLGRQGIWIAHSRVEFLYRSRANDLRRTIANQLIAYEI